MAHSYQGLSSESVLESRKKHGANILSKPPKASLLSRYLEKCKDPLIVILLVAGLLSIAISFYEFFCLSKPASVFFEPVGIFMAVLLATGIAFLFELKADREFELINQVSDDDPVTVIRDGHPREIPKKDVVVGDIILLTQGQEIPADAELLEATALEVDESSLTGEPSCTKTADPAHFDSDATFPSNHVLRGTFVLAGHAVAKVFAVGDATENGRVMTAAQIDDSVKTPLNEQLEGLGALITKASYVMAGLILVGRTALFFMSMESFVLVDFIAHSLQSVLLAVTLIVVAVPEGLPMAVTLSLAYSMRRMFKTNNLVRKMHACETMGAVTVICTDKTGTLTQNRMTVQQVHFSGFTNDFTTPDGLDLARAIACNSTAELETDGDKVRGIGNPTEVALLAWLHEKGVDYRKIRENVAVVSEIPFSTENKYMASVVKDSNARTLYVKGAPEIVMNLCSDFPDGRTHIEQELAACQGKGMRTLALAKAILGDEPGIADGKLACENLAFMGIVAIADPVREDVPDAVKSCTEAGIQIKVVTGDVLPTAREISRQIGLWKEEDGEKNALLGPEIAQMTDEELRERARDAKIISRARPLDKERLVRALEDRGEVVAVTGDGTNDAPALHAAHVGLSMGSGTNVAKEASDITIIDDSFASIGRAVLWGRSLYRNIQRFILFQMTVNVAACLVVLVGAFMGTESPLTVTQMLWVNLIMDTFAAMALASLPPSNDVMKEKPRGRTDFIISKEMRKGILGVGLAFFVFLTGLAWHLEHVDMTDIIGIFGCNGAGPGFSAYERGIFFSIFVFLQWWNLFNARAFATGKSAFHLKDCNGFLTIVGLILVGQVALVSLFPQFFGCARIGLFDWIAIIMGTSVVLWIGEGVRLLKKRTA